MTDIRRAADAARISDSLRHPSASQSACHSEDPGPTAKCLIRIRLPQLRAYLRRKGYSEQVIEKVIDQVIWAALPHVMKPHESKLRDPRQRKCWVFNLGDLVARQVASRKSRLVPLQGDYPAPSPEESDRKKKVKAAVEAALPQLTEPQRRAVECCDIRRMTLRQASVEIGRSPDTVESNRLAGLRRLAVILAPLLPEISPRKDICTPRGAP